MLTAETLHRPSTVSDIQLIFTNISFEKGKSNTISDGMVGHHTPAVPKGITPSLPNPGSCTDVDTDSNNIIHTIGANYSIDRQQAIDVLYERLEYSFSSNPDFTGNVISFDNFYKF